MVIPISIGYHRSEYEYVSKQEAADFVNSLSESGYLWEYDGKVIVLKEELAPYFAYPTVDFKFIATIYSPDNKRFPEPNPATYMPHLDKITFLSKNLTILILVDGAK